MVSCALAQMSWAGDGYLAKVGPSPLRFQVGELRCNPALVLPPLKMSDEGSTNAVVSTQTSTNAVNLFEEIRPAEEISVASTVITAQPFQGFLGGNSNPEENAVNPQVFLRYFNKSGNQEALLTPQVPFMPPAPSAGSSAIYISE